MNQMSPRLARAIEAAKSWPEDRQNAAAEVLEEMEAFGREPFQLTEEDRADLEQAMEEMRRGEYASDAEVEAMFRRHGL